MVNIVLADDHIVVRKGLIALLSTEPDLNIIGEAENGIEALELVSKLKPDVLLLDLMMPLMNGLEVTRSINRRPGQTRVVILTMHSNDAYVTEALRCGAMGFILKEASPDELIKGIREVAAGNKYLGSSLYPIAESEIDGDAAPPEKTASLTKREEQILQMAARGLSNQEIADKLRISQRTVETHRNNLMHKLDLHSQIQLTNLAIQRGMISLPDISRKD